MLKTAFFIAPTALFIALGCNKQEPEQATETTEVPITASVAPTPNPATEPTSESLTYQLTKDAAMRVAAEMVAESLLGGGPEEVESMNQGSAFPVLLSNFKEEYTKTPQLDEYGMGLPLAQWPVLTTDNTRRSLAAVMARKVANLRLNAGVGQSDKAPADPMTDAEIPVLLCEVAMADNPRLDYGECLKAPPNDKVLAEATACATAIVERNRGTIHALADVYSRTVNETDLRYADYRYLDVGGSRHRYSIPLHQHVIEAEGLDPLTQDRKGLPAYCKLRSPAPYPQRSIPRRVHKDIGDNIAVTASYAARSIVAEYLFKWNQDELRNDGGKALIRTKFLKDTEFRGHGVAWSEQPTEVVRDQAGYLGWVGRYAGHLAIGERDLGAFYGTEGKNRLYDDAEVCRQTALTKFPNSVISNPAMHRVETYWFQRCFDWANLGFASEIVPSVHRETRKTLASITRCADAVNKEDAPLISALQAKIDSGIRSLDDTAALGMQYDYALTYAEVNEVITAHPPVVPSVCK